MASKLLSFLSSFFRPQKRTTVDLISLTAHQLKNPIASLELSLKMMLKGDFGRVTKEQRATLDKMLQKSEIMASLVDDLLHASKIDSTHHIHALVLNNVNVGEVIESLISLAEDDIIRKGIVVTFKKESRPLIAKLDQRKITIALQNLLDNALKYTPAGGRITINLHREGETFHLCIEDSGIGIPHHDIPHLFQKFFRASNAIDQHIIGSGLGLYIARDMIEAHHGTISCMSQEHQGSTFVITLPIKPVA